MRMRIALIASVVMITSSTEALADYPYSFVEVRCVPELSYFSVQRFTVMNLPFNGRYLDNRDQPHPVVVKRLTENGILTEKTTKAEPYTCRIPPIVLKQGSDNARPGYEVKLEGVIEHPPETGSYRQMTDDIRVRLNGKVVGGMGLNPYSIGFGDERIEISPNGLTKGKTLTVNVCSVKGEPRYEGWDLRCEKRETMP